MATDKDTTTRTVKDAGEDVTKATRGAAVEAADAGKKVTRDAADTMEKNIGEGCRSRYARLRSAAPKPLGT